MHTSVDVEYGSGYIIWLFGSRFGTAGERKLLATGFAGAAYPWRP